MAPSCLVQSSMAANQGRTRSRKPLIVSSMAILLNAPMQRAAMCRTAVYGCCRQVNRCGRCSSSYTTRDRGGGYFTRRLGATVRIQGRGFTKGLSSADMAPVMTSSTCRELTSS